EGVSSSSTRSYRSTKRPGPPGRFHIYAPSVRCITFPRARSAHLGSDSRQGMQDRDTHGTKFFSGGSMKVAGKAAGTAAILLAAVAGKAWAFGPFSNTQVCGGTAFVTCATLTTTYDASTNTLTLQIANTSANGDRFTAFGVRGLPDGLTVTGTPDPGLASDWSFAADVPQLGGDPDGSAVKYSGFGTNQGINGAIANDGNTYTFVFTFSGAVDVNTLEFALHSQGGPNGC